MILVIVVAAGVALMARRMLVTTILPTVVAILLAATIFAAALPNRVGKRLYDLNWRPRVVAFDHQLADASNLFGRVILDDDRQARTWAQLRRERIVQQLPVAALALEMHAGHVQCTVSNIAD